LALRRMKREEERKALRDFLKEQRKGKVFYSILEQLVALDNLICAMTNRIVTPLLRKAKVPIPRPIQSLLRHCHLLETAM
jgi:hypothetical protein